MQLFSQKLEVNGSMLYYRSVHDLLGAVASVSFGHGRASELPSSFDFINSLSLFAGIQKWFDQ